MKFGYLEDISSVDFSLPPDHPDNEIVLPGKPSDQFEVYLGIPRWNVKEWRGKVFEKTPKDPLNAYATVLNSIEMNTTHYRIPKKDQVEKWKASANGDFLFCPKVPQSVSHRNPLNAKGEWAQLFFSNMELFGEQLGHSFMQFAPHFKTTRLDDLINFLHDKPAYFPLAVELRHEGWFEEKDAQDRLFQVMKDTHVIPVISDTSGRRDALHMRLTAPEVMVRFVGNDLHDTDYQRLKDWVDRLKYWKELGLSRVYFFLHQHDDGLLPETINFFIDEMEKVQIEMPRKIPIKTMF